MATENKLMTLNFAASLLGPNEVYLEVGSWKGLSIIGAMMGNYDPGIPPALDSAELFSKRSPQHPSRTPFTVLSARNEKRSKPKNGA